MRNEILRYSENTNRKPVTERKYYAKY